MFSTVSSTNSFEVYVTNEDLIFTSETSVHIQWSPESIFPTDIYSPNLYTVDIELFVLNINTRKWVMIHCLSSSIANNGSAEVTIPNLSEQTLKDTVSPVVIGVGLSSTAPLSTIFKKLVQRGLKTYKYSPIRYLVKHSKE